MKTDREKGYSIADFDDIEPVECPCGLSRRAFGGAGGGGVATLHRVDISVDARVHYHKELTEIYFVLDGSGHLELDGDRVPLRPGRAVLIRPYTRHRAIGDLRLLVVSIPEFDPSDEWFD